MKRKEMKRMHTATSHRPGKLGTEESATSDGNGLAALLHACVKRLEVLQLKHTVSNKTI